MNISYWEQDIFLKHADVVVVGAGLVGLHAAWRLKQLKSTLKVVVLEAGPWPGSASLRNAGFACFGSPSELLDDLSTRSETEVSALIERRLKGLSLLRKGLGDNAIGYSDTPSHEVFSSDQATLAEACLDAVDELNRMLKKIPICKEKGCHFSLDSSLPNGTTGFSHAIRIHGEGQIHPGKMMNTLAHKAREAGVIICHGWPVETIHTESTRLVLEGKRGMRMAANKVLLATNGFTSTLLPKLDVQPARNQVLITEPIPKLKLEGNFHARAGYVYFRNVGNRILVGGFRDLDKNGETTSSLGFTEEIQEALNRYIDSHLLPKGSWRIAHRWSGTLGVGASKSPIIEEIQPGLWCAVRLGGMGVALGAGLGIEAAERLTNSSLGT